MLVFIHISWTDRSLYNRQLPLKLRNNWHIMKKLKLKLGLIFKNALVQADMGSAEISLSI